MTDGKTEYYAVETVKEWLGISDNGHMISHQTLSFEDEEAVLWKSKSL